MNRKLLASLLTCTVLVGQVNAYHKNVKNNIQLASQNVTEAVNKDQDNAKGELETHVVAYIEVARASKSRPENIAEQVRTLTKRADASVVDNIIAQANLPARKAPVKKAPTTKPAPKPSALQNAIAKANKGDAKDLLALWDKAKAQTDKTLYNEIETALIQDENINAQNNLYDALENRQKGEQDKPVNGLQAAIDKANKGDAKDLLDYINDAADEDLPKIKQALDQNQNANAKKNIGAQAYNSLG